MNRNTGAAVQTQLAHLRQSIVDILTTPIGTRVERRSYGSLLPELIDHPDNAVTRMRLYAATASALMKWEPRLRVNRVRLFTGPQPGQCTVELQGELVPTGRAVGITAALQMRAAA